ncbi:MAG: genetic competence negative regulator [Bacillaceae bacterium]|nr:genetic competence negative regulator [Bacillaceae bacterium]
MRIERLSQDKIRFFLTFDDLSERGIEKEDMWRDIPKVHELFNEMMEQAYKELGFEVSGPVAVEVFALPAQGMVVIVTRGKTDSVYDYDDSLDYNDIYELEVTLEESDLVVFSFADFEHLIEAAHRLQSFIPGQGKVYLYKNRYYMVLDPVDVDEKTYDSLIAILSEYAEASTVTQAVLQEYGQVIIEDGAVDTLCQYFK